MKKLIAVLVCLLSMPLLAANQLVAISESLLQPAVLTGQFQQAKHMQILNLPLHSSGSFAVLKDQGVLWQLEQPFESTMTITENGLRGADIDDNRAMQYVGNLLMQLLSGDFTALEKQFELFAEIDEQGWQLQLKPRSALIKKAVTHIQLSGGEYIHSIELSESSGDSMVISLLAHQAHTQAPEGVLHALSQK